MFPREGHQIAYRNWQARWLLPVFQALHLTEAGYTSRQCTEGAAGK